jgi:hypothetical protein
MTFNGSSSHAAGAQEAGDPVDRCPDLIRAGSNDNSFFIHRKSIVTEK